MRFSGSLSPHAPDAISFRRARVFFSSSRRSAASFSFCVLVGVCARVVETTSRIAMVTQSSTNFVRQIVIDCEGQLYNEMIKVAPVKPTVSIDVLQKLDIRVGTIKLVEDVKGSDKLVKLTVDFGDQLRTILVGMKQERAEPKQIEGVQTLFVVNLEPKKIMGEVSEGMLLDIGYADGIKPVLALPEAEVPNGIRAGQRQK